MEIVLDYWDRKDYSYSWESEIKNQKTIEADDDIAIFEKFYKMNNSLRYCNGSYYKFNDKQWQDKYNEWLKTDDYKSKSFNLYYGNGVVD
jgi:hypothetical protein